MKRLRFEDRIDEIFAAFARRAPEDRVKDAIFSRVESLPDDFMDYAARRIRDYAELPRNLGAHLFLELWPDYRQANPEICARNQPLGCIECQDKTPGLLFGWNERGERLAFKCVCAGGGWTKCRIEQAGYCLTDPAANPALDWRRWKMPEHIRGAIGSSEPPRERHVGELERMEADW